MESNAAAPEFQRTQAAFAARIRDPHAGSPPEGVSDERMALYAELFFNNVAGLLAGGFPVLRRVTPDERWAAMVRDFLRRHRSNTPLFPEIGGEFLDYLEQERGERPEDPPFLRELAHYEWVEVALGLSEEEPPAAALDPDADPMSGRPTLSPLAWPLHYAYPVHRIGPEFQPDAPEPVHLIVYRDRDDRVGFLEANPVTARLIQRIGERPQATGRELLEGIAAELNHPEPAVVIAGGRTILDELRRRGILLIDANH